VKVQLPNVHEWGYRLLGDFPSKIFPYSEGIKNSLAGGRLRISYVVYVASMFFWTLLSILLSAILIYPITTLLNILLNLKLTATLFNEIIIGGPILVGAIVAIIFLYYPISKAESEKTEVNKNLVYIVNYMGVLAGAGVTTEDIFLSLAEGGDIYHIAESSKSITRDIGLLGKDVVSAIERESEINPSKKYSKLLTGLIGVNKTGGDLKQYFADTAEREMEVRRRELGDLVNKLNLAAEIYTVVGIAFPIILIVLLSLMGIFGGEVAAGMGPIQMISLMTYVLFPVVSVGLIIFIDGLTSSW